MDVIQLFDSLPNPNITRYVSDIELKECEARDNNLEDILLPNNIYILPQVRHE